MLSEIILFCGNTHYRVFGDLSFNASLSNVNIRKLVSPHLFFSPSCKVWRLDLSTLSVAFSITQRISYISHNLCTSKDQTLPQLNQSEKSFSLKLVFF